MKSIFTRHFVFSVLMLFASGASFALAGGLDGGGGIGVLCNGKLRILDVYEAEEIRGLTPLPDQGSVFDNLIEYTNRYYELNEGPKSAEEFRNLGAKKIKAEYQAYMRRSVHFVNGPLLPTTDATLPPMKPGCKPVQIATQFSRKEHVGSPDYLATMQVNIDRSLWKLLDNRNRAALLTHENRYGLRRSDGLAWKNSDDSRKEVIAQSFEGSEPVYQNASTSKKRLVCSFSPRHFNEAADSSEFQISDGQLGGVKGLVFEYKNILREEMASHTSMFIPGIDVEGFLDAPKGTSLQGVVSQKFEGRSWKFQMEVTEKPELHRPFTVDPNHFASYGRRFDFSLAPVGKSQSPAMPESGYCTFFPLPWGNLVRFTVAPSQLHPYEGHPDWEEPSDSEPSNAVPAK